MAINVKGKMAFGPSIATNGLILYLDPANSSSLIKTSILNMENWIEGDSGSCDGYAQNGQTSENIRVLASDPWGNGTVVWECDSAGSNSADGGFVTSAFDIDSSSLYRFSVWVNRRSTSTSGTFYFGLYAYDKDDNNVGVTSLYNNHIETNPYWQCDNISILNQDQWYLLVGHVFPYNYSGNTTSLYHTDSGFYTRDSGKIGNLNGCNLGPSDCQWLPSVTSARHRAYLFYSTSNLDIIQFYDPRVDIIDGSEPTISMLLRQSPYVTYDMSGNKYDGTLSNININTGVLSFQSSNSNEITFGSNTPALYAGTNDQSWNIWLNFTTESNFRQIIFAQAGGGLHGFGITLSDTNNMIINVYGTSGGDQRISAGDITSYADKWHMWTYVIDHHGHKISVYCDGSIFSLVNFSIWDSIDQELFADTELILGATSIDSWYYQGFMSCISTYNRQLSQAEIQRNYDATKGRFLNY